MPSMFFPQSNVGFVPSGFNTDASTGMVASGERIPNTAGVGTVLQNPDYFGWTGLFAPKPAPEAPVQYPSTSNPFETDYAKESFVYNQQAASASAPAQQAKLDAQNQQFANAFGTPGTSGATGSSGRTPVSVPKVDGQSFDWKPVAIAGAVVIGVMMLFSGKK